MLGYNFRLTEVAAAIGQCQLERNTARRQAIAARYHAAVADLPIGTPVIPAGRTHVFHQYTIAVGDDRDGIVADLATAGVGTGIYYPIPVHRQPYVLERGLNADLPTTDWASGHTLSLPIYPTLPDEDQDTVIAEVRAAVERRTSAVTNAPVDPSPEGAAPR